MTKVRNRVVVLGVAAAVVASVVGVVSSAAADDIALPPANAKFDYQIGEPYRPPSGVRVVSRDRESSPAAGLYNICYVNAYQTQPSEIEWWQENHDDLLLKNDDGEYVIDGDWNEILLDVSTSTKRNALAGIVGDWIDGCAGDGFDAVEPDNLDSWDRSEGYLEEEDSVAFATLLAERAHGAGLAFGQKNATDLADDAADIGFDFAVAESCGRFDECDTFTDVYGANVIVIEYREQDFERACDEWGDTLSIVLRDRDVTAPGSSTYVYDAC